jgi:hypothetical protein
MSVSSVSQGRILWLDPNKANNVMVNPEDLCIKVEFSTKRKGRSIIYSGTETINTGDKNANVTFIEGTSVDDSGSPSLTTRYTEAISLDIMNPTTKKNDDFESLGIESIDIEFNTANTPLIKIKFIDVRGNAILSQGNMSKYSMFFELPYPTFSLKVKGFYGGTVNYCLHMQRWNASFNSETGNFEIQADFMGFTYALLTDLLIGLIRAAVRTERGQKKLLNKQNDYGENSNLVITIDDMLTKFVELNNTTQKISESDTSASELQSYDDIDADLESIQTAFNTFSTSIYDGVNPANTYFRSSDGVVLCVSNDSDSDKKYEKAFSVYTDTVKILVNSINNKIGEEDLKLNEKLLNYVVKITDITKAQITGSNNTTEIINHSSSDSKYSDIPEDKEHIKNLLSVIGNLGTSVATDNTKINIYNLKPIQHHITNIKTKLAENKVKTETEFTAKLADTSEGIIGFEPTIRNIFRVLSINAEIFLEVLKDVSIEAQTDKDGIRAFEFNKIAGLLNVKQSDVIDSENKKIYPWPEYRQEKSGEGYVETWLGKAPNVVATNINEVVFTKELHTELLNVARFDKELQEQIDNAGADVDSDITVIEDAWYPVSPADTPINSLMTQNPYIEATNTGNVDEIKRLVLLRTFTLLGVSTFNSKIDSSKGGALLKTMGKLEAENLVAACRKLGPAGQQLLATMLNLSTTGTSEYVTAITKFGADGSTKITNPGGVDKKPILIKTKANTDDEVQTIPNTEYKSHYYKYVYIRNDRTKAAYIPVNTAFDGSGFYYNNNTFKSKSDLKELSSSVIFVSNPKNYNNPDNDKTFRDVDDGSLHVKLFEPGEYQSMIPTFGQDSIDAFKASLDESSLFPRVDSAIKGIIEEPNNSDEIIIGLNPYNENYSVLDIRTLNYELTKKIGDFNYYMGEPQWNTDFKNDSSLLAFFTEYKGDGSSAIGTFLSYPVSKQLKDNDALYENDGDDNIYYRTSLKQMVIPKNRGDYESFRTTRSEWLTNGFYTKQKTVLSSAINKQKKAYFPFIEFGSNNGSGTYNISLFGSYFYYKQKLNEVRALLFLHTIPWQGVKNFGDDIQEMMMLDKFIDWTYKADSTDKYTRVYSIRTLFQANGAFVHAPKGWVLFIGGMLWRLRYTANNNNNDPINFSEKDITAVTTNRKPLSKEYLYYTDSSYDKTVEENGWGMYFESDSEDYNSMTSISNFSQQMYVPLDKTLMSLPKQVRDEFINYFQKWVDSDTGFKFIQQELELYTDKTNYKSWFDKNKKVISLIKQSTKSKKKQYISRSQLNNLFGESVVNNYALIVGDDNDKESLENNLTTILKPNTTVMDNIVALLKEPTIIQNVNPNIWNFDYYHASDNSGLKVEALSAGYEDSKSESKSIRVRVDKFRTYLGGFYDKLISLNEGYQKEKIPDADDEAQQDIFGTGDDDTINLMVYRILSSINDKWLNGSENKTPFSQCGTDVQNKTDLKFAKKYRTAPTEASLIDTFRFVDRAFADIGDKFYLNINSVTDLIRSNYNQSYFDIINKILADNNFNFIPLPTFINFNDINELKTVFSAYTYNNPVTYEGTGPSFVCVYVGQASTNLDLGADSAYPDDGLSFTIDDNNSIDLPNEAQDFNTKIEADSLDGNVPVFAVNYGQQNQNYFRSIKLDQREFTETMESLQVIETISQTGDKSKPTYAGNNLFNVYQTRSYSAEVEMLGSAMIQPMMYFQLNNIPMFRGAYLIYKVTHSIKPHSMTTTFKGNRVKKAKTPLMDKATMLMNLVGTPSGGAQITSSRAQADGYYAPIVKTLIDNGGTNGNVEVGGKNPMKPIPFDKLGGIYDVFNKKNKKSENILINEAVDPLVKMLNDWVTWMRAEEFKGNAGNYAYITSIFRDFAKQEQVKRDKTAEGKPKDAATPGLSPHGWGIAVDLQYFKKNGDPIRNDSNTPASFKIDSNPAIKWLYDNSYMYGWVLPYSLRDNAGIPDEHWHWEYHGTAAKCMVEKNPTVYGYKMDTSGTVKDFVKNPKDTSGKEAVYTGCDTKYVKMGDGAEMGGNVNITGDNPKDALIYLIKDRKFPSFKAIGAIAAMMGESGVNLNPKAQNIKPDGSLGAYGIAQWLGDRLTDLKKLSNYDTFEVQIKYLFSELDPTSPNVDGIAKPFIIKATTAEEMLAAMATFERWKYPACLAKGCEYGCDKKCGDGNVTYGRAYDILVKEVKAKNSPDESFRKRIGYLAAVQKLYNELKKSGKL